MSHSRDSPGVASHDNPDRQGEFSLANTMRDTLRQLVLRLPAIFHRYSPPLRLDASGIVPRTLGVYFKDLRVVGKGASSYFQNTVGSRLNPKFIYEDIRRAIRPGTRDILSGFNGVVRPGEMLRESLSHGCVVSGWVITRRAPQLSLAVLDQDAPPFSRCSQTTARPIMKYRVKFTTDLSLQRR